MRYLLNQLYEEFETRFTDLYDEVLTDYDMINEQKNNGLKHCIFDYMVLSSDLSDNDMEALYCGSVDWIDDEDLLSVEVELDYLMDNLTYDRVLRVMRRTYDQLN